MTKQQLFTFIGFVWLLALLCSTTPAWAGTDMFIGDTAIYSGDTINLKPNVLFLIDNSAGMRQGATNTPYDPATVYPTSFGYATNTVYTRSAATGGTINYVSYIASINSVTCATAKNLLLTTGYYAGPLKKNDGSCNASQGDNYYLGNFLNYTAWALTLQYPAWQGSSSYRSGNRITVNVGTAAAPINVSFEATVTIPAVSIPDASGVDQVIFPPATSGATAPNFVTYNTCIQFGPYSQLTAQQRNQYNTLNCGSYVDGLPDGGDSNGDGIPDLYWKPADNLLKMIQGVLKTVISGARQSARFGIMTFGSNNAGGQVVAPVKDVDADSVGTGDTSPTDYTNLMAAIDNIAMLNANSQPVNELFWDTSLYFRGLSGDPTFIGTRSNPAPPSPIQYTCQDNYVFLITTGVQSTSNPITRNSIGDLNLDGRQGYSDDGAKYLYDKLETLAPFNTAAWTGVQKVRTTIVQVMTPQVPELVRAAADGHGLISDIFPTPDPGYYHANNSAELAYALVGAINTAIDESDTSFVAPVVPTSPENRTYSGERIYLGFFQPIREQPWRGNLKKYGFNADSQVVGMDNQVATSSTDGSFLDTARSFWGHAGDDPDGSLVQAGGVGQVLVERDFSANPRRLYTNRTVTPANLTDSANAFNATNVPLAETGMSTEIAKGDMIRYLEGYDVYDDDADGDTTEKRAWILGDVLHSKPLLVNYNSYPFSAGNESNCSINKTVIYVGTNDGFFHAFRDCDGEELWAFVPKPQLITLKELTKRPARHAIYNDASTTVYIYDADQDGNIGPNEDADGDAASGANDKVLIVLAARRGGEYIMTLDVTNPAQPILLNTFSRNTGVAFNQLKETWSEPKIGKIKYLPSGSSTAVTKLALFYGGGYDNRNEDTRFGATMYYPNATPVPFYNTLDSGYRASGGAVQGFDLTNFGVDALGNYVGTGRGIYAVELATLSSSGVPTIATTPRVLWSKTFDPIDPDLKFMAYSFPSDLALTDTNYDDYVDRIYVGDAGGQIWRVSGWDTTARIPTSDPLLNDWVAKRIFIAGAAGMTDVYPNTGGRKIFYRPSITFEPNGVFGIYFGSGDREHPLNTHVVDRFFAVYDRGQDSTNNLRGTTNIGPIDEADLVNVTSNSLQDSDGTGNSNLLNMLYSTNYYGWFISLNLRAGEKVLAPPLVLNKVAYFTTYTPNTVTTVDPCAPGNLGVSRAYAVNYKTGEAVLNFDHSNDSSTLPNDRAAGNEGEVLLRSDREMTVGVGIPSGIVPRMPPNGDVEVYIGGGGGLRTMDPVQGGTIIPVYWLKW